MALRKVTLFDHDGLGNVPVEEDGQAKPAVLGVRWLNLDTLETIRARGGKRTDPHGRSIEEIPSTADMSPFKFAEPLEVESGEKPA